MSNFRLSDLRIISGNSHPKLAKKIAFHLNVPLTEHELEKFANGEIRCLIKENIRGKTVVLVQTGCSTQKASINDYIMELMIMLDAIFRSNAKNVIMIIPNYPYARQDKKDKPRVPISAKLFANMITMKYEHKIRVITVDLHSAQIQGFFECPIDNLWSAKFLAEHFKDRYLQYDKSENYLLVSPDEGGIKRMNHLGELLGLPCITMCKNRSHVKKNQVLNIELVGQDDLVKDKVAVLVDDMCDTGGTICKAADVLVEKGAEEIYVMIVHPILSGPAISRLYNHSHITNIICTNTLPLDDQLSKIEELEGLRETTLSDLRKTKEYLKFLYNDNHSSSLDNISYEKLLDIWKKYRNDIPGPKNENESDKDHNSLVLNKLMASLNQLEEIEKSKGLEIDEVDLSGLLGKVINNAINGESISALFED